MKRFRLYSVEFFLGVVITACFCVIALSNISQSSVQKVKILHTELHALHETHTKLKVSFREVDSLNKVYRDKLKRAMGFMKKTNVHLWKLKRAFYFEGKDQIKELEVLI